LVIETALRARIEGENEMHKAIIISTMGVTIVEGPIIHVCQVVDDAEGNYYFAFVYDSIGKLVKAYRAKHYNPIEENFF